MLCGLSVIICMTFPVAVNKEALLDFRFIPLIIAFLYGGYRCGFIISIILIMYRLALGGTGFYLGGLWMTTFFLTIFYFALPRMKNWSENWRKNFPYLLLTFSLLFFALGTQFLDDFSFNASEIFLWLWFSLLNYITLWMVLFLQNSINEIEGMNEKVIQFEKSHTVNHLLMFISQQMLAPIKTSQSYLKLVGEETLTNRQAFNILQTKNELIQAERSLENYLTFMDTKLNEQKEMSFVKELKEVVELMKSYAEMHKVELIYTSTAQEDIFMKGEPSMLRFALLNIIKNGIEACSPKGQVTVCLHEMLKEVYIVIEDNGMGIPQHLLGQLGKPLTSGKVNGTGLGLASTFKIAKSMGGRVEVESSPNIGTIFSLYFPKWELSQNSDIY
jgi:two-component system, sporulation sensor kinase B